MPERLIRPRRPIAWNQLLRKGHAHQTNASSERRAAQRSLLDEAQAYLEERNQPDDEHVDLPGKKSE